MSEHSLDLTTLPHESWCDLGSTHAACCPGKAVHGCSCLTGMVVRALDDRRGAVVEAARALVLFIEKHPIDAERYFTFESKLEVLTDTLDAAVRTMDGEPT